MFFFPQLFMFFGAQLVGAVVFHGRFQPALGLRPCVSEDEKVVDLFSISYAIIPLNFVNAIATWLPLHVNYYLHGMKTPRIWALALVSVVLMQKVSNQTV